MLLSRGFLNFVFCATLKCVVHGDVPVQHCGCLASYRIKNATLNEGAAWHDTCCFFAVVLTPTRPHNRGVENVVRVPVRRSDLSVVVAGGSV